MNKLELHLHTNASCNLSCIHCYNRSGETAGAPEVGQILDAIRLISTFYHADIHLEGGEIFLRPNLLSAMSELSPEILQSITITTNGTIFLDNPEIIRTLRSLGALRVSVEGHTAALHEQIRGGSFRNVLENAQKYQDLGVPLCLRITLNRLNYRDFVKNTIGSLAEKGFSHFQTYEFQSVGRGENCVSELSLNFPLTALFQEMSAIRIPGISLKMMFAERRRQEIFSFQSALEKNGYQVMELPREEGLSIHANGDVYKCAWDNNPKNKLCNWYLDKNALSTIQTSDLTHRCEYCSSFRIALEPV